MSGTPNALLVATGPVELRLQSFLAAERDRWTAVDETLSDPMDALLNLVMSGGKRLRPAFCHWGHVAAGGNPDSAAAIDAGAAIELLHAFALAHDDVMDGSVSRRGQATAHISFAAMHREQNLAGDSAHFGESVAMLVGDLAYAYADKMMAPRDPAVAEIWDELRVEVNIGQYLDVLAEARREADIETSRRILEYKTGRYSVQRPLQLGVALAGGTKQFAADLNHYGRPVGIAFQLRDDLLDAFGETELTGKPVGIDLRDGKPTPLLAAARANATGAQAEVLALVGKPEMSSVELEQIQQVMQETGAPDAIEAEIRNLHSSALAALESVPMQDAAREALAQLALFVAYRQH